MKQISSWTGRFNGAIPLGRALNQIRMALASEGEKKNLACGQKKWMRKTHPFPRAFYVSGQMTNVSAIFLTTIWVVGVAVKAVWHAIMIAVSVAVAVAMVVMMVPVIAILRGVRSVDHVGRGRCIDRSRLDIYRTWLYVNRCRRNINRSRRSI